MDLHGNISRRMVEASTACVFYRENPHVDARQRGRECAEVIYRTVTGEVRPVQWLETPPLVINIVKQYTGMEPLKTLMDQCEQLIRQPGILSASVIQGYPYADVEEMGMSFLVVADRIRLIGGPRGTVGRRAHAERLEEVAREELGVGLPGHRFEQHAE